MGVRGSGRDLGMGGCKGSGVGHLGGVRGLGFRAFGQEDLKRTRQEFRTSVGIAVLLCALQATCRFAKKFCECLNKVHLGKST